MIDTINTINIIDTKNNPKGIMDIQRIRRTNFKMPSQLPDLSKTARFLLCYKGNTLLRILYSG